MTAFRSKIRSVLIEEDIKRVGVAFWVDPILIDHVESIDDQIMKIDSNHISSTKLNSKIQKNGFFGFFLSICTRSQCSLCHQYSVLFRLNTLTEHSSQISGVV